MFSPHAVGSVAAQVTAVFGTWTPLKEATSQLWLDPASLSASPVSSWVDKKASLNFIQTTPANQPAWSATLINGKPGLTWASPNQIQNSSFSDGTLPVTMVGVIQPANATGNLTLFGSQGSGGLQFRVAVGKLNFVKQNVSNVGTSTLAVSTSALSIVVGTFDGTNWSFRINGADAGSGALGAAITLTGLGTAIGFNYNSSTEYMIGPVGDLMKFQTTSLAVAQKAEGYLAAKYGITLPAGHPYANRAP